MNTKMLRKCVLVLLLGACNGVEAEENSGTLKGPEMLSAAIFVQNRASADFEKSIDTLNDLITARLTEKGFSIIDKDIVATSFRESRDDVDAVRDEQNAKVDAISIDKTEATVENVLTSASALRLSQMIGADYLVIASITSAGRENRSFKGKDTPYGSDVSATMYSMRISLRILEGKQGGTVYGDVVTATEKVAHTENFESDSTDIVNKLLDNSAAVIADNVVTKIGRIRDSKPDGLRPVEFTIKCNIEDATVELDGAALGSAAGKLMATPGLHQLRISREWFATWDKTVNIYSNQVLTVAMELSAEGRSRYKDTETFKMAMAKAKQDLELEKKIAETKMDVAREQSEADAYAQKQIAEGEKKKREQSYIRDDGFADKLKQIIHGK